MKLHLGEHIFESLDEWLFLRRVPAQPVAADLVGLQIHLGAHQPVNPQPIHGPTMAERLDAIPGAGAVTAATVLATLPELGRLSDRAASALVAVAPFNRDSGQQTGGRHIAGGRKPVRCANYRATLSAVRYDANFRAIYQRLRAAGKKLKVALVACLRKLVVLMYRLLKNPNCNLQTNTVASEFGNMRLFIGAGLH